jgi:hypothetical protein
MGLLTSLAGDGLDIQWEGYEASHGEPPPQVSCIVEEGAAAVDAFVGFGGTYAMIDQESRNPDLLNIMSVSAHIGENPDLCVRMIQGKYDTILLEERIQASERLLFSLADEGYNAEWLEVESGHIIGSSGEVWEYTRQVIMDAARP